MMWIPLHCPPVISQAILFGQADHQTPDLQLWSPDLINYSLQDAN